MWVGLKRASPTVNTDELFSDTPVGLQWNIFVTLNDSLSSSPWVWSRREPIRGSNLADSKYFFRPMSDFYFHPLCCRSTDECGLSSCKLAGRDKEYGDPISAALKSMFCFQQMSLYGKFFFKKLHRVSLWIVAVVGKQGKGGDAKT